MNFVIGISLVLIVSIAGVAFLTVDDTDRSFFRRSGAYLITDHKTGLQYLAGPKGGITPRLDENGKHMRIEK